MSSLNNLKKKKKKNHSNITVLPYLARSSISTYVSQVWGGDEQFQFVFMHKENRLNN